MSVDEKLKLVSGHIDDALGQEERWQLDGLLAADAEAAEMLCDLSLQAVLLRRLFAEKKAAAPLRQRRKASLAGPLIAAAAMLALAVSAWVVFRGSYPEPRCAGDFVVKGGGVVGRGAVVEAGAGGAAIELGGYCRAELAPHSVAEIRGGKLAEEIFLRDGGATCDIKSGKGAFKVATEAGTVSVKGTRFEVRSFLEKGEEKMETRKMFVKVLAGAVLVSGAWGTSTLAAGDTTTVPPKSALDKPAQSQPGKPADDPTKAPNTATGLTTTSRNANNPDAPKAEEMTLTGKLTKQETNYGQGQGGDKQKTITFYTLECADGTKVKIHPPKADSNIKLDDFVGKNVEMVVMAVKVTHKTPNGKEITTIRVTEVKSIKEAPKADEKKDPNAANPGGAPQGTDPNKDGADNKPASSTTPAGGLLVK